MRGYAVKRRTMSCAIFICLTLSTTVVIPQASAAPEAPSAPPAKSTAPTESASPATSCAPHFSVQNQDARPHSWKAQLGLKAERGHFFGDHKAGSKVRLVSLADPANPVTVQDLTPTANWGQSHIRVELPGAVGNPPYGIAVEVPSSQPCPAVQFDTVAVLCPVYSVQSASQNHATPQWGDSLKLTSSDLLANFGTFGSGSSVTLMQLNPLAATGGPLALQDLTPVASQWKSNEIVSQPLSAVPLGAPGPLGVPPLYGVRVQVPGSSCVPNQVTILRPCPAYTVASADGHPTIWWQDQISLSALAGTNFGPPDNGSSVKLVRVARLDPNNPGGPLVVAEEIQALTPPGAQWTATQIVTKLPAQPAVSGPYGLVVQVSATTPASCLPQPLTLVNDPLACPRIDGLVREGWRLAPGPEDPGTPLLPLNGAVPAKLNIGPADTLILRAINRPDLPGNPLSSNPLVQAINTAGSGVSMLFGFVPATPGAEPHEYKPTVGSLSFGDALIESPELQTLLHPQVVPAFGAGPDSSTWRIKLQAQLTLPWCSQPIRLQLLDIEIAQLPLVIPTVTVLFEHENYGGAALVLVAADDAMLPGLPLAGAHVDARTDYESGSTVDRLIEVSKLAGLTGVVTTLSDQIDLLSDAFQTVPTELRQLPPLEQVGRLAELLTRLNDGRMVALVRQQGGSVDLGEVYREFGFWWFEQKSFASSVSSMIMFGAPTDSLAPGLLVQKSWPVRDLNVYELGKKDLKGTLISFWPGLDEWNDAFEDVFITRIAKTVS